ncbi:MAG: hypothetical protein K9H41_11020 [Bacteroidia bacterium]|jgi:hypothetical protein|nr:hypothetical protein [Bacteroidia bacterium]
MINKHTLILVLSFLVFSCNQNKVSYNPPDQKDYINQWNTLLTEYNETDNSVKKDELIEKCTQLFNEHKSFTNWKGQVKEINSYDDYAQLVVAQMITHGERSDAEFHIKINKDSPCYNLIKSLKESDEIVFSGTIDSEISITGNGKITEPELVVNCKVINGVENTSDEIKAKESDINTSNTNATDTETSNDRLRDLVNEKISNKYFYNDENGLYTVIKFEPLNEGAPLGVMILSQLKCHYSFGYTIIGNKIETEYMESTCGNSSTNRTFFYDEENDYLYLNMNGQKFIFTDTP